MRGSGDLIWGRGGRKTPPTESMIGGRFMPPPASNRVILVLLYWISITDVSGVGALTNHLSKHHRDVWDSYVLQRDAKKNAVENAKKSEQSSCEMENAALRFTDTRSNAGQLSFLNQVYVHPLWLKTNNCQLPPASSRCTTAIFLLDPWWSKISRCT